MCDLWGLLDIVECEGAWNHEMTRKAMQLMDILQDQVRILDSEIVIATRNRFWN